MLQPTVAIGIQARSTSKRLPGKVFEMLGNEPVLSHVLLACQSSQSYLNKNLKFPIKCFLNLLIPKGDAIKDHPSFSYITKIEGDEFDVLSRYRQLADKTGADFIVRVTGDCPLIPPFIISKAITLALMNRYDYISNVDPEDFRLTPDGWDVEVMSRNLVLWMDETAKDPSHREHVTLLARRDLPSFMKRGVMIPHLDLSDLKVSIDTAQDLEFVREKHQRVEMAVKASEAKYGKSFVHRF